MSLLTQTHHIPLATRFLLLNSRRFGIRESIHKHKESQELNRHTTSTCLPYSKNNYELPERSGRTDIKHSSGRIVVDGSQENINKSDTSDSVLSNQYNSTEFQLKRVHTINKLGNQLFSLDNRFQSNTSKLLNKKSLYHLFIARNNLLARNGASEVPRFSSLGIDSIDLHKRDVDRSQWISLTSYSGQRRLKLTSCFRRSATYPSLDYLLEMNRHFLTKPLSVDFVQHKLEERLLDLRNKHTHYNNSSRNKNSANAKAAVSFLAMLGFFRGLNATDQEEENSKLTDEQRIKKMKPVEILIARGVLAMCDQEYREADIIFHKALSIAQTDENEEQETLVLNLLASNCFESGDYEAAERLFIDLMKRMIAKDVDQTDPAILELSLKLSSIYSTDRKTHDKALEGFKFVISSLLNRLKHLVHDIEGINIADLGEDLKNELALLGWSYDWFGKYLIAVNDFKGAAEMLQKALQISSKVLGPLHDQTLILLNDIGTTLAMNNAPEKGETFIQKAVGGAIESQSKELASFYVNLGLVKLKLRKYSEAKRYCEYSIELALKNGEQPNSQEVIALSKKCLDEVKRLLEVDTDNQ